MEELKKTNSNDGIEKEVFNSTADFESEVDEPTVEKPIEESDIEEKEEEDIDLENSMTIKNNERIKRQQNIESLIGGYYESSNKVKSKVKSFNNETKDSYNKTKNSHKTVINFNSNQEEVKDFKIVDPSREYSSESLLRTIYKFDSNEILRQLRRERILFITCPNDQIVNDAACFLFNNFKEKDNSLECRILAPTEEKEKELCQSFQNLFINNKCKIGKGKNTFLIIDEVDTVLFDSFRNLTVARLNTIKGKAEKDNTFVVILIHRPRQINILQGRNAAKLVVHNIQFLDVLLRFHDILDLKAKIIKQKEYGLWGKDDEGFYQWITGFLKEGRHRLKKEVEIREEYKEGEDLNKFLTKHIVRVKAEELLEVSPLSIRLAFIATYLPRLSLNRLEEILLILIKGETPISKKIKTINSKGKKVTTKKKVELLDIWNDPIEGGDKVLYDSHIRFFEDEDGMEYYSFSEPYLIESLKVHFDHQKRRFLQNSFKKILESGVFFNPDTKGGFLESLVALSLKMAIKNPEEFGVKRMLNIFYQTHYLEDQIHKENDRFMKVIKSFKKHHVLDKLCLLLIEMLKVPKLKQLVDEMLIAQIGMGQHIVVFDVIKKLHHSPDFESLFWLKRLIDNGTKDVRKEAYVRLIRIATEKPDHIQEFLSDLTSWHPGEKDENFSPSNYASLAFIIDFTFEVDCENPGDYPVSYPLFLNSTTQQLDSLAIQAIDWLFHPSIELAVNNIRSLFGHKTVKLETIQSDIIEYWYMMICGKTLTPITECKELFNSILLELDKRLRMTQKKAIYISLQKRIARILNWLEDIDAYSPIGVKEFEEKEKAIESGRLLYQVEEFIANLFYNTLLQNS